MRRFAKLLLFLLVVAALLFAAWKFKLIPDPFGDKSHPDSPSTPHLVERASLRVASADRPEKLMLASLQRLLKSNNRELELVEYNPDTVWLELASGEIDLVVAPVGEAVMAQGRFNPVSYTHLTLPTKA